MSYLMKFTVVYTFVVILASLTVHGVFECFHALLINVLKTLF
jgi:hypothetical protein